MEFFSFGGQNYFFWTKLYVRKTNCCILQNAIILVPKFDFQSQYTKYTYSSTYVDLGSCKVGLI